MKTVKKFGKDINIGDHLKYWISDRVKIVGFMEYNGFYPELVGRCRIGIISDRMPYMILEDDKEYDVWVN